MTNSWGCLQGTLVESLVACQPRLTQPWELGSVVCHDAALINKTSLFCVFFFFRHLSHKDSRRGAGGRSVIVRRFLNAPKNLDPHLRFKMVRELNSSPHIIYSAGYFKAAEKLHESIHLGPREHKTFNYGFTLLLLTPFSLDLIAFQQ